MEAMISIFETILALKKLMLLMEVGLGIDAINADAKTLLLAISDVQNSDGSFISYAARNYELTNQMPIASYHRALKALINNKFIKSHPKNRKVIMF